jgi:hypothetical protein
VFPWNAAQADSCFSAIESRSACASRKYLGARRIWISSSVDTTLASAVRPTQAKQQPVTHLRLGAREIGRDRVELFQRLVEAPDFSQRPGIKQLALRRLKVRPVLLQVTRGRDRLGRTISAELGVALPKA